METFKHMEGFNTQTHLIHNHSKVSEKRHGIHLLHTDHITHYCIEVSAPSPQRPAEDTYSSFLQGSHPWVPPPDHGGTTQNIPEVVSNRYSGLEDRFPLLILRWHFRMCSCTPELVGWEEKSDFFFFKSMYSSHTRRAEGTLIAVHSIFKKGSRGEVADLLSLVTSTRI